MIRSLLLLSLATLTACASSAPSAPMVAPPEPVVEVPVPPPPPPQIVETEVPQVETPVVPPPSPRLRISQRSVYEEDRAVRWTLENGLTVWYAWDPDARVYAALVSGPVASSAPARSHVQPAGTAILATADRFDQAASQVQDALRADGGALSDWVVSLHGSTSPEWLEAGIAEAFGALRGRAAAGTPITLGDQAFVRVDWDDLPTLSVVAALIADRASPSDQATVQYDAVEGEATVTLVSTSLTLSRALASAPEGDVRSARARAARLAQTGPGIVATMASLERLPGRYQPARPPSEIRDLPSRIERTPPDRVNALLARLAAATPASR